jgi:hypothetical protein
MSDPRARRTDRYGRQDIVKILCELDRLSRITADRRTADVRSDRLERLREWFAQHLAETQPQLAQPPDTLLGHQIGDKNLLGKSSMSTFALPITQFAPSSAGGWLLTAQGAAGAPLRKAFRRLKRRALGQMSNPELPKAGEIVAAEIVQTGGAGTSSNSGALSRAEITARITDPVVAEKIRRSVYPLVAIKTAANEVVGIDLVDTDAVSKGGSNRQVVILKLYQNESSPMNVKKIAKLLSERQPQPVQIRKATPAGAAMASALIATPIVPDAGNPETRQLATNAALTLIKAARERGPIRDPRLTMTAGR